MGRKYKLQIKLANFFLIVFQILLVSSITFTIMVTYLPNIDPNSSSLVGFWKGSTNELTIPGIVSISVVGFGTLISILLLISYKNKGFTFKANNAPSSLLLFLIFFNLFVLLIGLIDKQNLFGGSWFSLLFKESPKLRTDIPRIINFNSFSIGSYAYWGIISLSTVISFLLWIRFLWLANVPEKIDVIIRKNHRI